MTSADANGLIGVDRVDVAVRGFAPVQSLLVSRAVAIRGVKFAALILLPAAALIACSLTVPADRQQCTVDSDCQSFATNAVCVSRICQAAPTVDAGEDAGEADPAWGCVGKVPVLPQNDSEPFQTQLTLFDFNKGPLVGLPLRLCRSQDTPCSAPVKELVTDAEGTVTLDIYTGFRGYVQSQPSEAHSTLVPFISYVPIINPKLPATLARVYLTAFDTGTIAGISLPLGVEVDYELGQIIFTARDCQNDLASDIVAFTAAATATSKTWYLDSNAQASVEQTQTSVPGVGGIFNVTKGVPTLKYERNAKRVGEQNIIVRPGTLTYVNLIPTP